LFILKNAGIKELARLFSNYFEFGIANHKQTQEELFRLRYNVYCEEFNYLSIEKYPSGKESDEYDSQSTHVFIRHIPSNKLVGFARIIYLGENCPIAHLPVEHYCKENFYKGTMNPEKFSREQICELSRLAVTSQFRPHSKDFQKNAFSKEERHVMPFLFPGLIIMANLVGAALSKPHIFALFSPYLAAKIAKRGIPLESVGSVNRHHPYIYRSRAPYHMDSFKAVKGIKKYSLLEPFYQLATTQLNDILHK
jgi:N-acyl amino acid synthase of PEP-CTERM/exosortase system